MKLSYQKCFNLGELRERGYQAGVGRVHRPVENVFADLKAAVEGLHDKSVAKDEEIKAERDRLRLEKIAVERQKKLEHDAEMRKIHPCYDCIYFGNCNSLSYDSSNMCEDYTEDPFADD